MLILRQFYFRVRWLVDKLRWEAEIKIVSLLCMFLHIQRIWIFGKTKVMYFCAYTELNFEICTATE